MRGDSFAMLVSDKPTTSINEMKQEGSWSKVFTVQPCIGAAHLPNDIWENNDKIVYNSRELHNWCHMTLQQVKLQILELLSVVFSIRRKA